MFPFVVRPQDHLTFTVRPVTLACSHIQQSTVTRLPVWQFILSHCTWHDFHQSPSFIDVINCDVIKQDRHKTEMIVSDRRCHRSWRRSHQASCLTWDCASLTVPVDSECAARSPVTHTRAPAASLHHQTIVLHHVHHCTNRVYYPSKHSPTDQTLSQRQTERHNITSSFISVKTERSTTTICHAGQRLVTCSYAYAATQDSRNQA